MCSIVNFSQNINKHFEITLLVSLSLKKQIGIIHLYYIAFILSHFLIKDQTVFLSPYEESLPSLILSEVTSTNLFSINQSSSHSIHNAS